MQRILLTLTILVFPFYALCQSEMWIRCFCGRDGLEQLKKTETGVYWKNTTDSAVIYISNNRTIYKEFDVKGNLIVEGNLRGRSYIDRFMRFGKWIEYYPGGKRKKEGFFYQDNPVGNWKFYYPNGNLMEQFSIAAIEQTNGATVYCTSGAYESLYENGKLKECGLFRAAFDSVTYHLENPITGEVRPVNRWELTPKKFGIWTNYKPNGEIEKTEDFPVNAIR